MSAFNFAIDDTVENRLFSELSDKGFACIDDGVSPEFLARLRAKVDALLEDHNHKFFSLINPGKIEGGVFEEAEADKSFVGLLRNLTERLHSRAAAEDFDLYSVLRVIGEQAPAGGAYELHYDATVLTVLMPIFIPATGEEGTRGELVVQPNRRPYRSSALINLAEKAVLQNPIAFRRYARRYRKRREGLVNLKPGNLYAFAGYRTFHGNLPCRPGEKRATLIFHFGNPHANDRVLDWVKRLRQLREERRLSRAA